jgi:4-aminobutyrate aminotransferase-like enzyme/Ser/Thr protein kinase RdoA (MazF antagonist)
VTDRPFDEEASRLLREAWGLEGTLAPLGGENQNHLVTTPEGARYVLKVADARATRDEVALERAAVRAVEAAGPDVALPHVLPTRTGEVVAPAGEGRLARLLTFVSGRPWGESGAASPERLVATGRVVAGLARALEDVDPPAARRTHRWDLSRAGSLRPDVAFIPDPGRRALATEAFRLWAGAEPWLAGVPHGFVHGDLNDENLLVEGDRVVGVLDFGDALRNPTVCDLAIALAYLLLAEPDPWDAGARLVGGYHAVRPLSVPECELLFPLMCGRLAVSVTIAAGRRTGEAPRDAWFSTEAAAWRALEEFVGIDPAEAAERLTARIEVTPYPDRGGSPDALLARRRSRFSAALSLSFATPLKAVRGRGAYLYDERGRAHLDLYNNVCHVGHCHPRVVAAGQAQMGRLNTNTRYLYDLLGEYADRLCATLPPELDHCFLVNSGSEANELALRLARTHTGHRDVIVLENAYHGHTGTLIDISPYKFDGPGGEGRKEWVHVAPMPDGYRGPYRGQGRDAGVAYGKAVGHLLEGMHRPPAAFIAESLPSVGGQIVPPEGYLETAFRHVRGAGGLCILDEVQVGFGRVGTHFWGFQQQDVVPDVVVMGKPIGNGHPLAAVVTTGEIARSFGETGMEYFSTFGGNPVSCAIGLAVLDVVEDEGLQEHALSVGTKLRDGLRELADRHPVIGDVRGSGLFIGLELVRDPESRDPAPEAAARLVEALRARRILTGTDGPHENVIKIKGPMVLTEADAALAVEMVDDALGDAGR